MTDIDALLLKIQTYLNSNDAKAAQDDEARFKPLLDQFLIDYPKDSFSKLTMDEYCYGYSEQTFCTRIQNEIGYGSIGKNQNPGLLFNVFYCKNGTKDIPDAKNKFVAKQIGTSQHTTLDSEVDDIYSRTINAIQKVLNSVDSIHNNDYSIVQEQEKVLNSMFVSRILFVYDADKEIPIYSTKDIKIFLDELGIKYNSRASVTELRMQLYTYYDKYVKPKFIDMTPYLFMAFLYNGEIGILDRTDREKSAAIEKSVFEFVNSINGDTYPFLSNKETFKGKKVDNNTSYAKYPAHSKNKYLLSPTYTMLSDRWFILLFNSELNKIYLFDIEAGHFQKSDFHPYNSTVNGDKLEIRINTDDFYDDYNKISFKDFLVQTYDFNPAEQRKILEQDEIISDKTIKGENAICYGIPGCGKSYKINEKINYSKNEKYIERIVFHPDYTYSDFVGQILPHIDGDKVSYPFVPGPFTRILKIANDNPNRKCYLIIEEINRGNAPAIFGDTFQLLDRDDNGQSRYAISNSDIASYVYIDSNHDVKIPGNLYIISTMNTSDQNVFTLDTAFKRRWKQYFVEDNIDAEDENHKCICSFKDDYIKSNNGGSVSSITWKAFHDAINEAIAKGASTFASFEDRRLGTWFVSKDELEITEFTNKVIRYLWDDVKKTNSNIFNKNIRTFEDIYKVLKISKDNADEFFKEIFTPELYSALIGGANGDSEIEN